MLFDLSELDNFGLLDLLRFHDEVFLNFAFSNDLFLLDPSDFNIAVHLDLAFLDDLFLEDPCALNLLLHLVFPFTHALFHFELELKGLRFPFCGVGSDILLLVGFCPRLLLLGFEFLDSGIHLDLDDSDLFFLDDPLFLSFLIGCDFSDLTDTDGIKSVFSIKRFNGGLVNPNNRHRFKCKSILGL